MCIWEEGKGSGDYDYMNYGLQVINFVIFG
jgi:hypothetical protein